MTEGRDRTPDAQKPDRYEIRLAGHLDPRWTGWFDGLDVRHVGDGTTVMTGTVADQAALHGLLQRVRDLGLPLVSVNRLQPVDATTAGPDAGDPR